MEKEKSCGCIIIKNGKVLLVQQTQGFWGFPKGHVEENETEEQTAVRETKEETNIDVEITSNKRYTLEYELENKAMKEVVYFIATPVSDEIKPQEEEILDIEWVDLDKVIDRLTFDNLKELMKKVMEENS